MNSAISLFIRNAGLHFIEIPKPTKTMLTKTKTNRKPWVPPVDHPWRQHKKAEVSTLQKAEVSTLV
jgi:hypothetical protein